MVRLLVNGIECRLDGEKWQCDDARLRRVLPVVADLDRHAYIPSIEHALADFVVTKMGGVIIEQAQPPTMADGETY